MIMIMINDVHVKSTMRSDPILYFTLLYYTLYLNYYPHTPWYSHGL